MNGIRWRPLLMGTAMAAFGIHIAAEKISEIRSWHVLAEQRDTRTTAQLTNTIAWIDAESGRNRGYEVSYEFATPGVDGGTSTPGGSRTSTAEVQDFLEEQFWGGANTEEAGEVGADVEETIDSAASSTNNPDEALPEGLLYFQGTHRMNADGYREVNIQSVVDGTVNVSYDADDPSNSAVTVADNPPDSTVLIVPLVLILPGFWLIWEGIKWRLKSTKA